MNIKLNKYTLSAIAFVLIIVSAMLIIFRTDKPAVTPDKSPESQSPTAQTDEEVEKEIKTQKSDLIRIENLKSGDEISSPLEISGKARGGWYFEASFPIIIVDENGKELGVAIATAEGDWMTEELVPFTATLNFDPGESKEGKIIFQKDNPSGLPEFDDSLEIPVKFSQEKELTIKVFFGNEAHENISCSELDSRERKIPRTQATAKASIKQLLAGPTDEEQSLGYFTSINPNVKLQKISIENGIAYVDFDEQLDTNVGGSCRVTAIRAQITETLKQFPTINDVVISINGRTEDILQP